MQTTLFDGPNNGDWRNGLRGKQWDSFEGTIRVRQIVRRYSQPYHYAKRTRSRAKQKSIVASMINQLHREGRRVFRRELVPDTDHEHWVQLTKFKDLNNLIRQRLRDGASADGAGPPNQDHVPPDVVNEFYNNNIQGLTAPAAPPAQNDPSLQCVAHHVVLDATVAQHEPLAHMANWDRVSTLIVGEDNANQPLRTTGNSQDLIARPQDNSQGLPGLHCARATDLVLHEANQEVFVAAESQDTGMYSNIVVDLEPLPLACFFGKQDSPLDVAHCPEQDAENQPLNVGDILEDDDALAIFLDITEGQHAAMYSDEDVNLEPFPFT